MINEHKEYYGAIRVYKNVFRNHEKIIGIFNQCAVNSRVWFWKKSSTSFTVGKKIRTSHEINLPTVGVDYSKLNPNSDEIRTIILSSDIQNRVKKYVDHYSENFGIIIDSNEKNRLVRYEVGEFFTMHRDDHPLTQRTISTVLYLNDNYDGGEIYFKYFDFKYKPEAGDLLVFPSNYAYSHESQPIKNGTKYVIVDFWKESVKNG